jgi:hypothetical protein
MPQPNDLSRSLVTLDQNSTIIAVIEISQSSWLVAGMLPGIERQPRKKLEPSPERLLAVLQRWRDEAVRAGRTITRIAPAFEAGRDGFWLARWLEARGVEAHVIHASSVAVSREPDPLPTSDPAKRAIEMAVAMRATTQALLRTWRRHGHDIGFGVGISQGYATLGQIGFAERVHYTAIGTVTNLAARLCAEAKDGQILISARIAIAVEDSAALEEIGDLSLKGLSQAVAVYNVVAFGTQPSAS